MSRNERIRLLDIPGLRIVRYPDPRLRQMCVPIDQVDDDVRCLGQKMLELMFAFRGVGLAAPQVGLAVRLFVSSPTFEKLDQRAYVNPKIVSAEGQAEEEEGCLSFPGISCKIKRSAVVTVRAMGLDGEWFEETGEDLAARIFQHEIDHLDGLLLVDRMGSVAKLANRKTLKKLEEDFAGETA